MRRDAAPLAAAIAFALATLWLVLVDSDARVRTAPSIIVSVAAITIAWLFLGPSRVAAPVEDVMSAAIARAMQRELLRPAVTVRHLEHAGEHKAPLHDTLGLFRVAVAHAAHVDATTARLYWFPRTPILLSERVLIDSDTAFSAFSRMRVLPDVYIFEPRGDVSTPPAAFVIAGAATLADSAPPAAADEPPPSVDGSRVSTLRRRFRTAVLRRDGAVCVLCREEERRGGKSALEAAHVVAARAPAAVAESVELLNSYDTCNGVTLCADCHYYFDRHLWHVLADGTAAVADALMARTGCERWRALHGCALRAPATAALREYWPPARFWAVQTALFEAARELRHKDAIAKPFLCDACCWRTKSAAALDAHRCRPERLFATPAVVRAFPALAEGALRLDFDDDDDDDNKTGDSEGD
jgi:hypothetical protein